MLCCLFGGLNVIPHGATTSLQAIHLGLGFKSTVTDSVTADLNPKPRWITCSLVKVLPWVAPKPLAVPAYTTQCICAGSSRGVQARPWTM